MYRQATNGRPYNGVCNTNFKLQFLVLTAQRKEAAASSRLLYCMDLSFQVDAGLLGEDVAAVAGEVILDSIAMGQSIDLGNRHVHGGNNHDNVAAHGSDMQMHRKHLCFRNLVC